MQRSSATHWQKVTLAADCARSASEEAVTDNSTAYNSTAHLDLSTDTLPPGTTDSPTRTPSPDEPKFLLGRSQSVGNLHFLSPGGKAFETIDHEDLRSDDGFTDIIWQKLQSIEQRVQKIELNFAEYSQLVFDQLTKKESWCKDFTTKFVTVLTSQLQAVHSAIDPTAAAAGAPAKGPAKPADSFEEAYTSAVQVAELLNKHLPLDLIEQNVKICNQLVEKLELISASAAKETKPPQTSQPVSSSRQQSISKIEPLQGLAHSESERRLGPKLTQGVSSSSLASVASLERSHTDLASLVIPRERSRVLLEALDGQEVFPQGFAVCSEWLRMKMRCDF
mmetsp:Transcript_114828/g.214939  ORF Transcript_114828/g.214939 Transcript_114828/m.214939 type:complete len:336 (+) Transcript_114828:55-1062(+)